MLVAAQESADEKQQRVAIQPRWGAAITEVVNRFLRWQPQLAAYLPRAFGMPLLHTLPGLGRWEPLIACLSYSSQLCLEFWMGRPLQLLQCTGASMQRSAWESAFTA